jgi:hypothetical protein
MPEKRTIESMNAVRIFALALCAAAAVAACGHIGGSGITADPSRMQNLGSPGLGTIDVASPTPSPQIFVANRSANSITEYPLTANGDATPQALISGARTQLSAPSSLGLDASRKLYVLNSASIAVFRAGAHGNVAPKFLISGSLTGLSNPQGIAVEGNGKTYVTNDISTGGDITAYLPGANGNIAPVQTIYDGSSFFFIPSGVALHGTLLYVADQGDQSINEYSAQANGIVSPVNVIQGLSFPVGVAVDKKGLIYVTDSNTVVVYAANATGFATPLRTISGSNTQLNGAAGLTVFESIIGVANGGGNSITVYPRLGNGNIAPLREISGSNTGLSGPQGVGVH